MLYLLPLLIIKPWLCALQRRPRLRQMVVLIVGRWLEYTRTDVGLEFDCHFISKVHPHQ